jgi:hypothetical protein
MRAMLEDATSVRDVRTRAAREDAHSAAGVMASDTRRWRRGVIRERDGAERGRTGAPSTAPCSGVKTRDRKGAVLAQRGSATSPCASFHKVGRRVRSCDAFGGPRRLSATAHREHEFSSWDVGTMGVAFSFPTSCIGGRQTSTSAPRCKVWYRL